MIEIVDDKLVLESKNRRFYEEEARRVRCPRYDPCPICYKCRQKASHLFIKCQICRIPVDGHRERDREFMIRRENFSPRLPLPTGGRHS